jgi:hypothetical protein
MTAETSVEYPYHVLDETTPWNSWLEYSEICHQLNVPGQPSLGRFMSFRRYLKSVGLL